MNKVLIVIATLALVPFAFAQGPDNGTPKEQVEAFLKSFSKGQVASVAAVESLFERNPFQGETDVAKAKQTVAAIHGQLRLFLDYELIAEEKLTDRYTSLTFVAHFERRPLLMEFRFYRPAEKTWVILSYSFSTNSDKLLESLRRFKKDKSDEASATTSEG